MPSLELGEATTADWASAWRVGGSKTYHLSYETNHVATVIMRNIILVNGRRTYLDDAKIVSHDCENGDCGST